MKKARVSVLQTEDKVRKGFVFLQKGEKCGIKNVGFPYRIAHTFLIRFYVSVMKYCKKYNKILLLPKIFTYFRLLRYLLLLRRFEI